MIKITKAVIAVAGSGTRLLPATKSQPKEMLPIVDKPIIQYLVEELVAAGIEDIILVTKWNKKTLEDHFDQSVELEQSLEKDGKTEKLAEIKKISEMANFIYVRQKGPYGNGTPVLSAASLLDDEPFIFAFGDDLVKSRIPFTQQLIDNFNKNGAPVIGAQRVPRELVKNYGIFKLKEGTEEIDDMIEKPSVEDAPSELAQFGRMILNRDIVEILKNTPPGKGNELWMTDAIREYVRRGNKVMVQEVKDGRWYDTGSPLNYFKASVAYAIDRDDIGQECRDYLKTLIS